MTSRRPICRHPRLQHLLPRHRRFHHRRRRRTRRFRLRSFRTLPLSTRAARAALMMEQRRQAGPAIDGVAAPLLPPDENETDWRLEDEDYTRDNLPEDKSTLPVKRYRVITADRYIGAILENAVNSQIPGRVVAVVERHVFGADGRIPLLPKGTRIVCSYQSLAKLGDTRLPLSCSRAIRPDGASIQLTDATGADQMARTGFIGTVDNRIWERYGTAFIVSVRRPPPRWARHSRQTRTSSVAATHFHRISGRSPPRCSNRVWTWPPWSRCRPDRRSRSFRTRIYGCAARSQ